MSNYLGRNFTEHLFNQQDDPSPQNLQIWAGATSRTVAGDDTQIRSVSQIIIHPGKIAQRMKLENNQYLLQSLVR